MLRCLFFFFFFSVSISAQTAQLWVDSTYNQLSSDQKIGQLFMVMAHPNGNLNQQALTRQAINGHAGGLIFSKGTAKQQLLDTKHYQLLSELPLFIGVDAEWGMAMRLSDVAPFPYQMTLGALPNEELIYALGKRLGTRKRAMGIHISFSPVADVNTKAGNPIIGIRSFGDQPKEVAARTWALADGLQAAGLIAVAKHFPGHGATTADSHKTLPLMNQSKEELDAVDLLPFTHLIDRGIQGIMVGHLDVPALDPRKNKPVSTAKSVVTKLLQEDFGFEGLIFTDALNMAGIRQYSKQPALASFLAGADVLLIPHAYHRAYNSLKKAYQAGIVSEERLAHSVKKILRAKHSLGLFANKKRSLILPKETYEDRYLKQQIAAQSITLVHGEQEKFFLPTNSSIAYIALGDVLDRSFLHALRQYGDVIQYTPEKAVLDIAKPLVVGFHADTSTPWASPKISASDKVLLRSLAQHPNVHLVLFAPPYTLNDLANLDSFSSVVLAYEQQKSFAQAAAQVLFGLLSPEGKLPVTPPTAQ
jgi:beta-glucosidase-like glycosyl hydrolase